MKWVSVLVIVALPLFCSCVSFRKTGEAVEKNSHGFVSLTELDPTILLDLRYFGEHNFVGRRIAGYESPKCLLSYEAATALANAQAELKNFGLSLKIYDCYRPQRAVNDFIAWAKDPTDTKMKAEFYPTLDKSTLFNLGYIASRSGHSRGSTVDLTIVPMPPPVQPFESEKAPLVSCTETAEKRFPDNSLDMGTGYDCFDPLASTTNPLIKKQAAIHRALLRAVLERQGFKNYEKEWWHYTLVNEPHPETYFDFPVQ